MFTKHCAYQYPSFFSVPFLQSLYVPIWIFCAVQVLVDCPWTTISPNVPCHQSTKIMSPKNSALHDTYLNSFLLPTNFMPFLKRIIFIIHMWRVQEGLKLLRPASNCEILLHKKYNVPCYKDVGPKFVPRTPHPFVKLFHSEAYMWWRCGVDFLSLSSVSRLKLQIYIWMPWLCCLIAT